MSRRRGRNSCCSSPCEEFRDFEQPRTGIGRSEARNDAVLLAVEQAVCAVVRSARVAPATFLQRHTLPPCSAPDEVLDSLVLLPGHGIEVVCWQRCDVIQFHLQSSMPGHRPEAMPKLLTKPCVLLRDGKH